ncbi:ATP-binding protein [Streptomyces adelaidensis]|uniref:ATP-binding protein n=1 Tax=Streptomyces adelaidensis TaxID=2796465 RepID=UPI0035569D9E
MNAHFPPFILGVGPPQYRMVLTAGEHSAHHIREIVRSRLDDWGMSELAGAVELGVTELVANVVRHVPDRRCTLLLLKAATGVRVEVKDGSTQLPVVRDDLAPEEERGRGLVLLGAVADKWGVGPRLGGGKTVWFECRCGDEGACL